MSVQKSPVMMLMLVLFIALVGATVWRIITALETHPGMVVADAYETGQRYGKTLENRNKLVEQGWKLELACLKKLLMALNRSIERLAPSKISALTRLMRLLIFIDH